MFFNNHNKKGLTIAELLVSIAILSFGLIAILRLMNFSIIASRQSKDQIIMANLAQEGLEIVRNIYDSGTQDLFGLPNGTHYTDKVNYDDSMLNLLPPSSPQPTSPEKLCLNKNDGIYSYRNCGTPDTPYTSYSRVLILNKLDDLIEITSIVSSKKSSFSLKMKLWKKQTP